MSFLDRLFAGHLARGGGHDDAIAGYGLVRRALYPACSAGFRVRGASAARHAECLRAKRGAAWHGKSVHVRNGCFADEFGVLDNPDESTDGVDLTPAGVKRRHCQHVIRHRMNPRVGLKAATQSCS